MRLHRKAFRVTTARQAMMLSTVLLLPGCGGDSGPSGLTASQVTGTWDLTVTGCLSGVLPIRLQAASDGALTSAVNAWTNDESLGFFRPLDGAVDLSTGATELHLWASGDRTSAALFTGTLGTDGSLTGTVTDPMPGADPIFHFSGGAICEAPATGHRR